MAGIMRSIRSPLIASGAPRVRPPSVVGYWPNRGFWGAVEGTRQIFGRYEIVRPFGAGGMGEILLARQPGLPGVERLVIIKKILPHLAQEPGFLDRFLDETRVAASLTHGNIVQVYEVGEVGGEYFMAMEFVDGMDLKEAFHRLRATNRRTPEDLALYILVEIAKALSYAHEKRGSDGQPLGIVHRDVSPANLLLSMDGQVKLTDFGVAKAAMRLSLTIPGTLHGKVYYMSPEQVTGEECDPRADVFSLGVVAYEMLAGRRPFEGTSEVAVLDKVRRCEPPPLAEVAPWVPGSLAAIVARALARDPADRYPTMEDFRQALSTYMLEAHTMVSARALAEFLGDLRSIAPERPPMAAMPTPIRPGTPRSLDDVAASLLGIGLDNAQTPVPLDEAAGSPHTRTLASGGSESSRTRNRRERARRVWPWIALAVGVVGLATGLWAWALINDLSRNARVDAPALAEAAPATATGAAIEARPVDTPLTAGTPPAGSVVPPTPAPSPAPPATPRVAVTPPTPPPPVAESSGPRKVSLKSDPAGARVLSGERELGTTPLDVTVPAGGTLRLELLAEGHGSKLVTLTSASASSIHVSLPPVPGRVKFRFFPADAGVRIDGRAIETTGNLVDLELPAGAHVLTLTSRDGERSRDTPFDVAPGRARALGTVELGERGRPESTATTSLPPPTEAP